MSEAGSRPSILSASTAGELVDKPEVTEAQRGLPGTRRSGPKGARAWRVLVAMLFSAALVVVRPDLPAVTATRLEANRTSPSCPTPVEQEVVRLVNLERAGVGLDPLVIDMRLISAARRHSDDMAANDFVSHTGSDGSSPWDRFGDAGYPMLAGGETIGAGYPDEASVVQGWMDSPPHMEILLGSDYQHIGVGYAYDADSTYGHYWTADFGSSSDDGDSPSPACDVPPGPFRIYLPLIQR